MKRKLVFALCALCALLFIGVSASAGSVTISSANFPDATFRTYVSDNFDTDHDGSLTDSERSAVKQIILFNKGISSLKGIEYFTQLNELFCSGNSITQLDLSGNTYLTGLYCQNNRLTSLDVSMLRYLQNLRVENNSLTELDLLSNTTLYSLYCDRNYLTKLDITNTKLCTGSTQWCEMGDQKTGGMMYVIMTEAQQAVYEEKYMSSTGNADLTVRLQEKRFGSRTIVRYIYDNFDTDHDLLLSDSELAAVTKIDVSDMGILVFNDLRYFSNLTELDCNNNELTQLDLTHNPKLTILRASGNMLSSLDVSYLTELRQLSVYNNRLTSLDLRANTRLHGLFCDHNSLTELELTGTLLFDGNGNDWGDIGCQSGGTLNVNMTEEQKAVFEDGYSERSDNAGVTVNVVDGRFPDPVFRQYVYDHFDVLRDGILSEGELRSVTDINVFGMQIVSLKGIELFPRLDGLICWNNRVTELDVSHNTALTYLHCSYNRLTELDVSNNTLLTDLDCEHNALTELDLSRNGELKDLYCYNNSITELDIAGTKVCASGSNHVYMGNNGNSGSGGTITVSMSPEQKSVYDARFAGDASNAGVTVNVVDGRFRDPALRKYVLDNFDTDHNGILSDDELAAVTAIYVNGRGIFTLDGIELFPNLKILVCDGNELTELDVSTNTQLTYLNCSGNKLKTLDVRLNGKLISLFCTGNELSKLNVACNSGLEMLGCSSNKLIELDVCYNRDLVYLDCSDNHIRKLDLSWNANLMYLYCSNNGIIALDLFGNSLLTELACDGNYIYKLDISGTQVLADDTATGYFGDRTVDTIYVTMTAAQKIVYDASFANDPRNVSVSVKLADERFADLLFRKYVYDNFDTDGDGALSDGELAAVTSISLIETDITTLDGIELFPNLTELTCTSDRLTYLDVSGNPCLTYLDCSSNRLTELDVSSNTALTSLLCSQNALTELDVSGNTYLTYLDCSWNELTELDVSGNAALTSLVCDCNGISSLELNRCTGLILLTCSNNTLEELDLSGNTLLMYMACSVNQLTELDLSRNTSLEAVGCAANQLAELDVSSNTALTSLLCSQNALTELDVSGNTYLTYLDCSWNELTELDVSRNTALTDLECYANRLTALDVSRNTALEYMDCTGNRMTSLDLTHNTEMDFEHCYVGSQMDNGTITISLTEEQAIEFMDEAAKSSENKRVIVRVIMDGALYTPAALTVIGEEAFAGTAFKHVYLSEGVTAIEKNAFKGCTALEYIFIPDSVTSIAPDAFSGCSGFKIAGYPDSAAEAYANAHGIPFEYYNN